MHSNIMLGRRKLRIVLIFLWICFHGAKVHAFVNDALNPVKVHLDVWHQRPPRVAIPTSEALGCERQNVYTCEEPPDTVPAHAHKMCTYRNQRYHEQVYRWVGGRGCLLYTPDFLYVGGANTINLNAGCFYGSWFAPCLEIAKEDGTCGCYPFDPGLEEVAHAVREALLPAAHGRWERCFYAAQQCCSHYMRATNLTGRTECEATFDGWTCWPSSEAGILATEVCSEFAYSGQGPSCNHYSNKQCYENGTWEIQTDYSPCSITPRLLRRYRYYIVVLSFSIASSLPAVFVFFFYRRLRITRVALHRNLLIAIIIRNVLVIVSRAEIYIDELTNSGDTVMSKHGIACRVLAVAERIAGNAVFVCMLVEGIYLHRLIVAVFKQSLGVKWLYGTGAVIAVAPVAAWAAVMAYRDNHSCWLIYTIEHIQWILDGPRVAILLVNTGLFIDVIRVLLTKIRNAENVNQLSTAKATLFLMPVFGTQFLVTALRPNTDNCTGEQIYYYVAYALEGLQGFMVAMLYCYVNKEVHALVKLTYRKTENMVVSRVRRESNYPRQSLDGDRRMTYSTGLPPNPDVVKDPYSSARSKLHVAEIISIQASERLAEILEPVYESIDNGIQNEGYDSLERSDADNDSGFIANRLSKEDFYGFTNASSISIENQDWIRCISSPTSSVCDNSFKDYEARSDRTYHRYKNQRETQVKSLIMGPEYKNISLNSSKEQVGVSGDAKQDSEYEDNNMLKEIMQYMDSSSSNSNANVIVLDPSLLSPNRSDDNKIIFVDD